MTSEDFRRIALSLPQAIESAHMGHPDFRIGGKIFATLSAKGELGMVKLAPDQQEMLCGAEPALFRPVPGGWGRAGATQVVLQAADAAAVKSALAMAWRNTAPPRLQPLLGEGGA
jgi:hypothetical protein